MTINFKHPAVVSSGLALVVLAAASFVVDLPWPFWAIWAVLAVLSLREASRER